MDNLLNAAARGYTKPFKKKGQHLEKIINESKDTILHVNIKSRTPKIKFVEQILKICPPLLLQVNDKGNTPLHVATENGACDIIKVLLRLARDITKMLNMVNSVGKTALDIAIEHEKIEVVKVLINEAKFGSFDSANNIGKILNFAAKTGDHEILVAIENGKKGKDALLKELSKSDNPGPDGTLATDSTVMTNSNDSNFADSGIRSKDTILHIHIESSTESIEFVKKVLELCPSLGQKPNAEGDTPLHVAAKKGKSKTTNVLLELESESGLFDICSSLVLQVNADNDTPLHVAAKYGNYAVVEILLKWAKDYRQNSGKRAITEMLKKENCVGKTAFDVAVEHQKIEVLKILMKEAGPDFFYFATSIDKIINLAAENGDPEILDLIANGNEGKKALNQELSKYDIPVSELQPEDTILHIHIESSRRESAEFVEKVLDLCPSLLQKPNAERDTPLHLAAKRGKSATTEILLKRANDYYSQDQISGEKAITEMLKKKNSDEKTAFDVAVECGKTEVLKMLIKEADPDLFYFATHIDKIINLAAESGDHEILGAIANSNKGKIALQQELRKDDSSEPTDTILHILIECCWTESTEFVEKVLELCPSVLQKVNAEGDTPLHVAAKCGKSETTKVLLKRAKDDHSQDQKIGKPITEMLKKENNDKKTAFDLAVEYEEIEVLKILIQEADPDLFDFATHIGKIIDLAAESSDHEILDAIAKDKKGKKALLQELNKNDNKGTQSRDAILHNYIKSIWDPSTVFVEKLLGICPSLQLQVDEKGDTPLNAAVICNEIDIARVLLKHAKIQAQGKKNSETKDVVKCGQYAITKVLKSRDRTQEEMPDWKIWDRRNYDYKRILDIAVENDDDSVVKLLIQEAGPEFLEVDENFRKILNFAARKGDRDMVDAVGEGLKGGMALDKALVNSNIPAGKQLQDTILHVHIKCSKKKSSSDFMIKIIDLCPSLLVKINEKGDTPLHVAAKCGHHAIVKFLLERAKDKPQDLESGLRATWQMLEKTNIEGNKAKWQMLKKKIERNKANCQMLRLTDENRKNRADWQMLRMTNSEGNTALHEAVRHGKTKVVEVLTKADSSFKYSPNHANETPLYLAAAKGYYRMVRTVLESKSAAHDGPNGMTALHAAVMNPNISGSKSNENPNVTMDFLDSDFDDSDSDDSGDLQSFDLVIKEILKKKRFSTKKRDNHGWTPLHYAAYRGLKDKVSLLLDLDKSAVYATNKDRRMTALHMAAGQGHKDIVKIIISKCVECCEMEDKNGWNVLHFAMLALSRDDLIDLLKNPLVENLINKVDVNGNTPLHIRAAAYRDSFLHIGGRQAINSKGISVEHMLNHGYHKLEEQIQTLFENPGNGQYQNGVIRERKDDECHKNRVERRKNSMTGSRKQNSHICYRLHS